jgi:hypothetical protein
MLRTVFKAPQRGENRVFHGLKEKSANFLPAGLQWSTHAGFGRNLQLLWKECAWRTPIPYTTAVESMQVKFKANVFTLFDFDLPMTGK